MQAVFSRNCLANCAREWWVVLVLLRNILRFLLVAIWTCAPICAELDALEMDMGEEAGESVPSYLAPDKEPEPMGEGGSDPFASLPAAPTARPAQPTTERPQVSEIMHSFEGSLHLCLQSFRE